MPRRQYSQLRWYIIPLIILALMVFAAPQPGHAQSESTTVVHIVNWGETLYRIAVRYGVSTQAIIDTNGLTTDQVYAGQRLVIPGSTGTAATTTGNSATHIVQAGENLYRIGLQYGLTTTQLMAANNLLSADQIYVGQTLTVPGSGTITTTSATATHVVRAGETLSSIATRYGISLAVLTQANNISNPSLLYSGQVLKIPGYGTSSATVAASTGSGSYTVQRGDTLFRVASRHNVTMDALMSVNQIASPDMLYVGQVLTIPAGASLTTASTGTSSGWEPGATVTDGKQVVVVTSAQMAYAYEDGVLQRQFVVSTGFPATPTVQGDFAIYLKYDSQRMYGPGYDIPNVPWVMYFYQGYALHGVYWHNAFGQPFSHGCVNLRVGEAEWLYNWAPIGTPVRVIY